MSLKNLCAVGFVLAMGLAACGDDGGGGGPDGSMAGTDAAGGGDQPPVISRIAWTQTDDCTAGRASAVTVTVDVDDPDTSADQLTFTGEVMSCGMLDAAETVVSCPQAAPYESNVTVTDPEGNSDTATFTVPVCEDGEVMP